MQPDGPVRQFVEFIFTWFPFPGYLQFFDVLAAVLNAVADALGIPVKFLGL